MKSNNSNEWVVLVDGDDRVTGLMEKLKAHQLGLLHRALSVFVFTSDSRMLLQKRADGKYHSPGLWTNTCCSHPREGETVYAAARRRLREEMGLDCELTHRFGFVYRAEFGNRLIEHEYDHVFTGVTDDPPTPNPKEVSTYKYVSMPELVEDMKCHPDSYTEWFKICINEHLTQITNQA